MTSLPRETDVIISGGGPVGLTLANLLGQAEIRVIVLEKNDSPYDIPRAITLDDEGCRTIQAAALDKQFMPSTCLLYTSPSPRDTILSRMPSSA